MTAATKVLRCEQHASSNIRGVEVKLACEQLTFACQMYTVHGATVMAAVASITGNLWRRERLVGAGRS